MLNFLDPGQCTAAPYQDHVQITAYFSALLFIQAQKAKTAAKKTTKPQMTQIKVFTSELERRPD